MRFHYISQHDKCDCGPACLAMVSQYYGLRNPIKKYREFTNTTSDGTSLFGMVSGAKKLGFEAEALNGTFSELQEGIISNEVQMPFIAHFREGHYVVVTKINNKHVIYYDPENGKNKVSLMKFESDWSGHILNLYPSKSFIKENNQVRIVKLICEMAYPYWKRLLLILCLSFTIYFFGIYTSYTFEVVIEEFSLENSDSEYIETCKGEHEKSSGVGGIIEKCVHELFVKAGTIDVFFCLLLFMYCIEIVMSFIREILVIGLSKKIDCSITYRYYCKFYSIPISDKNMRSDGDYISRFSDSHRIRYAISNAIITIGIDSVLAVMGGVILVQINPRLFLFSVGIIALYGVGAFIFQEIISISNRRVMYSYAEFTSHFKEVLEGYEYIKSAPCSTKMQMIGKEKYDKMLNAYYNNDIIGLKVKTLLNGIEALGNLGILWIGFFYVFRGTLSLAQLITFNMLLSYFTEPLKNIIQLQPIIQSAKVALERIYDIFDIDDEDNDCRRTSFINGDVMFDDVLFRYRDDSFVLQTKQLKIDKESLTAIVGSSGSGKTTLMKLLLRLYEPSSGFISINNIDISQYGVKVIREKVSYVDNKAFMFENSILFNLALNVNGNEANKDLERICRICKVDEIIKKTPLGYDLYVKEGGKSLSQGERQRIAVARAVLSKPEILILDEALSNVKTEMAIDIIMDLRNELPGCTIILITHVKELIDCCERVIEIGGKGEVCE